MRMMNGIKVYGAKALRMAGTAMRKVRTDALRKAVSVAGKMAPMVMGVALTLGVAVACGQNGRNGRRAEEGGWSGEEKSLINAEGELMRVLTINDRQDSLVLRTKCAELTAEELASPEYATLAAKMLATVTSPEQDGVGIAGPQVGILRRVAAVMRYDKEGVTCPEIS